MKTRISIVLGVTLAVCGVANAQVDAQAGKVTWTRESPPPASRPDPVALTRASARLERARHIAARYDREAVTRGLGEGWRLNLISNLMLSDEQGFVLAESAIDLDTAQGEAIAAVQRQREAPVLEGSLAKALGTATSDLVYVPITPCRILDTRGHGAIAAHTSQAYFYNAINPGNAGCAVSSAIPGGVYVPAAEAVNVTVVPGPAVISSGSAFLAIYPDGGTKDSSWMNYISNQNIAQAGVASINQSNGKFDIFVQSTADVVVDVFGVFVPPQATALDCVIATTNDTASANTSSAYFSGPDCPAGYSTVSASCTASGSDVTLNGAGFSVTGAHECGYSNYTASEQGVVIGVRCCRVPGR